MLDQILGKLREGNRRFASNRPAMEISERRRIEVARGQVPFAAVLSCADSRVPPEIIFDQGLGNLFVVRTAGLVLDRAALGSLELGVAEFHIPAIVVLGHARCGAVKAAMEDLERGGKAETELAYLAGELKPAVEQARRSGGDVWNDAARIHIERIVERLRRASILDAAVRAGKLGIVAGWYDLDTGFAEIARG